MSLVKNSKRKKSPLTNKKNFSLGLGEKTEGEQELAGYSQIFVPGYHEKLCLLI